MRVTIASGGSEEDARAVAALALGLKVAGHESAVVRSSSGAEVSEAATGADLVLGLGESSIQAAIAAQQVGAVCVLASLQPVHATRDFLPASVGTRNVPVWLNLPVGRLVERVNGSVVGGGLSRLRNETGSASLRKIIDTLPVLGAWSPTLVPRPADWPKRLSVTGQWLLSDNSFQPPGQELDPFLSAGERPIYVGFGSLTGPRVDYAIEQILEAFGTDYRVLLSGNAALDVELPENVHRIGNVPTEWLFPLCGAILHQADADTAHAVARSGIPSLPVTFAPNQPFWAERLYKAGVATKPIDPRSGWEAYKSALRETVALRAPAKELAGQILAEDGVKTAVALLEGLVSSS